MAAEDQGRRRSRPHQPRPDLKVKDFTDRTGWSAKKVQAALDNPTADAERVSGLQRAVADTALAEQITPFLGLLRFDELGLPAIFPAGSRYVTRSHRRAATGTHYTPRSLAEEVAEGALQPLVYRPGPLETSDSTQWKPRPSTQILELKVADIAMGSGAFLVAACRYLADRLIEAWLAEGDAEALAMDLHRTGGPRRRGRRSRPARYSRPAASSPNTASMASTSTPSPSRWRSCPCG